MNKHLVAEIVLGALLLGCLGLIAWEQWDKSLNNAVATQTAKVLKQAQDDKDKALEVRDEQYKSDLKEIQDRYERLSKMTPRQIVEKVPEYIPGATKPIVIWQPGMEPPKEGDALVPKDDINAIAKTVLDGQKCKVDFAKCSGDLVDWKAKYDLKEQEARKWETAAKGGSWFHRFKNDAIKVGIGVGVGYLIKR